MACVDTSRNPRIPILMEMVGALSRAKTPKDVLETFGRGLLALEGPRGYISLSTRGLAPGEYRITRMLLDEEQYANIAQTDPWSGAEQLPVHRGGFLGELIRQAYPELIHHLNVRHDPIIGGAMAKYGSLMAIPLFDDGEPLNWAIILREDPEGFSVAELEQVILRSNVVGTTVKSVLAANELREVNARAQEEVERIARIQRALLPDAMPDIPGVSIEASYETFDLAGGDMYTLRPLRPMNGPGTTSPDCCDQCGPWGILISDVSGHGPAAAVVMAMLHAIIETYPREPAGPAEVLEYANRHLHSKRIEHSFVTALFAIYDPATRRLCYARAGHHPVLRMRRVADAWDIARLDGVGEMPLGILDDASYSQAEIQLEPGDSIVFYTDGIVEAMSPGGDYFGVEGIERSLTHCTGAPYCVINHVRDALITHEASRRPMDDQTLVVMRVED